MAELTENQLNKLEDKAGKPELQALTMVEIDCDELAELVRAYRVCGFILASCRCEFRKGHSGPHSFEAAF